MEFLVELLLEIFGAILEAIFESITLPKWLKITVIILFFGGLIALLVLLFLNCGWLLVQGLIVVAAIGLLVLIGYLIFRIFRFGSLRRAKEGDLPQIMALYRSVIGTPGCHWSITYPNNVTLHDDFRNNCLFVLKRGRKIIGAGSIVPKNELDDLECWWYKENAREIARIVIDPKHQGKSYGKYLVNALCRKLGHDCEAFHILVSDQNNHAKNLYREAGFLPRGPVELYDHHYIAFERCTGNKVKP